MAKIKQQGSKKEENMLYNVKKYTNVNFIKKIVFDPAYLSFTCCMLIILEIILNVAIIEKVRYTEIDWIAYMQEVEGFVNGTWDYKELKGDTGPLVYPAGFVYLYTILYYITQQGRNIYLAQYIFMVIYIIQLCLTFRIYKITAKVPPYALVISTLTSYRIHSIYVLRLFNDPLAVLLFYASLNLFLSNKWRWGSVLYSLAVSIKMNILLYSPCLLIAFLINLTLTETILNLVICASIQLVLGLPFLCTNMWSYLKGSFDLGRIFEHKWTVNYRFLDRSIFEARYFHISLLVIHITLLLAFLPYMKKYFESYSKINNVAKQIDASSKYEKQKSHRISNPTKVKEDNRLSKQQREFINSFETQLKSTRDKAKKPFTEKETSNSSCSNLSTASQLFVLPFFITNFIGIVCSRSLHYQFYSWYFHSLLYMVHCTGYNKPFMFLILAVLEYCWNVYPSSNVSSLLLHVCHLLLLLGVYRYVRRSCMYIK